MIKRKLDENEYKIFFETIEKVFSKLRGSLREFFVRTQIQKVFLGFQKVQNFWAFIQQTQERQIISDEFLRERVPTVHHLYPGTWNSPTSPLAILSKFHSLVFSAFLMSPYPVPCKVYEILRTAKNWDILSVPLAEGIQHMIQSVPFCKACYFVVRASLKFLYWKLDMGRKQPLHDVWTYQSFSAILLTRSLSSSVCKFFFSSFKAC